MSLLTVPSFTGLRALLKNKNVKRIRRYHLDDLRNHAMFHFKLIDKFGAKIAADNADQYVFAIVGESETRKQVYYPSADVHAMEILVGVDSADAQFVDKLKQVMQETVAFAVWFLNVADEFIAENLGNFGFHRHDEK